MSPVRLQARHHAILDCEQSAANGMELDLDYMTLHHEERLLSNADRSQVGRIPSSAESRYQGIEHRQVGCGSVLLGVLFGLMVLSLIGWFRK